MIPYWGVTSQRAEVPVLVLDDGRSIADSTIICEYLEQVHPTPPVYPHDAFERSRMRGIEDLCDRTFDAVGFGYFLGVLRKDAPEAAGLQAAARDECAALIATLERELGDRDYFCGELSLADLSAICHAPMARTMKIDMSNLPRMRAWMDRMRKIPAVAADHERAAKAWQGVHNIAAENSKDPTAASIGATAASNSRSATVSSIWSRASSTRKR